MYSSTHSPARPQVSRKASMEAGDEEIDWDHTRMLSLGFFPSISTDQVWYSSCDPRYLGVRGDFVLGSLSSSEACMSRCTLLLVVGARDNSDEMPLARSGRVITVICSRPTTVRHPSMVDGDSSKTPCSTRSQLEIRVPFTLPLLSLEIHAGRTPSSAVNAPPPHPPMMR